MRSVVRSLPLVRKLSPLPGSPEKSFDCFTSGIAQSGDPTHGISSPWIVTVAVWSLSSTRSRSSSTRGSVAEGVAVPRGETVAVSPPLRIPIVLGIVTLAEPSCCVPALFVSLIV